MARGVAKTKVKVDDSGDTVVESSLRQVQDEREVDTPTDAVAPEPAGMEVPQQAEPNIGAGDQRKRITRIRAASLHAALKDVTGVIGSGADIPVLRHVLFQAIDGRIVLTGTDLDIWVWRELASDDRDGPASGDWIKAIRNFGVLLPAKALAELVGSLDPDAMVTVEAPDHGAADQRASVSAGRSRYRLHCLPVDDFPLVPSFPGACCFEIGAAALADAFAAVEHAISSEETRYYLNGIYLHPAQDEGQPLTLRLAATDGHRLARLAIVPPEGAACLPPGIIARRTVALLDRLLAGAVKGEGNEGPQAVALIEIEADGNGAASRMRCSLPAADGGEIVLTAKMIDGAFPDYTRVIPSVTEHSAVLDRTTLGTALKRVMVLAERESRTVKASFARDLLRLTVSNLTLGEAVEELPCDYAGPEISIGFNGKYWRDALAALASDNVEMGFTDPGAPVVLVEFGAQSGGAEEGRTPRLVQVLMPMRVV